VTETGAARVELGGRGSRVATGVAVLDHLLEELADAGGFALTLEIAPDEPEAEVERAGAALGFQQTALAVASSVAPPVFAVVAESASWGVAFGLAAILPLAGAGLMRRVPA